jgi:hypothetical protein
VTLPLAELCPDWNNWTQKPPSAQFTTLNGIRSDRRHLLKAFAAPLESLFNTIVMISVLIKLINKACIKNQSAHRFW